MSSLKPLGTPFIELPVVDSTNNYAMGLVREGMAQHGTAVFAREQNKGKGQRDKHWASCAGQNIALSLVVEPHQMESSQIFLLSMAVASGTVNFFNRYVPDEIKIKWPNDIYWRDRKAAGILIENIWQGSQWKFSIVGIGINVNQTDFGPLAPKAVSMKQVTGISFEPVELAKELCADVDRHFNELLAHPENTVAAYKAQLFKLNEAVKLKKDNRIFEAIVKDVTLQGQLVVQHGVEERFDVGEIEWVI